MKRIFGALLAVMLFFVASVTSYGEINENQAVCEKFEMQNGRIVFDGEFLKNAGTTASDWYVIALKALGYEADYDKYLDSLSVYVEDKYKTDGGLHPVKATEWHRISLAVKACGGNPEDFAGVNLIADGIFNRDVEKQGINGCLWSLIVLSDGKISVPENSRNTVESLIDAILSRQLSDGGFALSGTAGDSDVTSMAVIALCEYCDDPKVLECVEEAVDFLSDAQLPDGGFQSYGTENCESTAQAIIALCSVGIDVKADERFVKNNKNPLENLASYKSDVGFSHVKGGNENSLSTQQSLLALAAVKNPGKSVYSLLGSSMSEEDEDLREEDVSSEDRALIIDFSKEVHIDDIATVKRLLGTVESKNPQDKFVLQTTLEVALAKAEKLKSDCEMLDEKILDLYYKGVTRKDYDAVKKLSEDFLKIPEEDRAYVTESKTLLQLEARIKSQRISFAVKIILSVIIFVLAAFFVASKIIKKGKKSNWKYQR